ncbi:OLC1v1026545C3 [Oldenlandia corymbosa var. corymbosa]|uniref:OLC1v1026545C3 n=1 Tax=Oldenlandia corymbosa var. corymbosa TaxID=529605 RepID=A0AAV1C926_OLDCO|nr:OLC1v1026545C3 [Oldenlandia corymbosa var. corymbosa]
MNGTQSLEDLLKQLEHILDADPLIDEVGFLHPSQFPELVKEAVNRSNDGNIVPEGSDGLSYDFWSLDHKLGISTDILLPLYRAAKHAFTQAFMEYKVLMASTKESSTAEDLNASNCTSSSMSLVEIEAMKHSRALLLLSCDFGTAWNLRKSIVSRVQKFQLFRDELLLSSLVLSYAPKSERAWSHRRWVIKMIAGKCSNLEEIVGRESEFVEKLAEKSKMNYRAWNHRCWLVTYMSREKVIHELTQSRRWAGLHIADSSCFHYRARLLFKTLGVSSDGQDSGALSDPNLYGLWKEELDWLEQLIRRYVGREALWLHRRFLSYYWITHFITHVQSESHDFMNVETFMDNELQLCRFSSAIPDNDFEDYEAQAAFSATYIMWLSRQVADYLEIDFQNKLEANGFKSLLENVCPQKSVLWDTLKC